MEALFFLIFVVFVLALCFLFAQNAKDRANQAPLELKAPIYNCFMQDEQIMLLIEGALENCSELPLSIIGIAVVDDAKKEYSAQKYTSTAVWIDRHNPQKEPTSTVSIDTTSFPLIIKPKESARILQVICLGKSIPSSLQIPIADSINTFDALAFDSNNVPKFRHELDWTTELLVYTSTKPFHISSTMTFQHTDGYYQIADSTPFCPFKYIN